MKVGEVLRVLRDAGWYLITPRGSHRQFKHPTKSGRVTVSGKPATIWLLVLSTVFSSKLVSSREGCMRYAIVIERAENNYSAYVPDLPGCVATGATLEETGRTIREAIELHLTACEKTACLCRSPQVRSNISKSRPNQVPAPYCRPLAA